MKQYNIAKAAVKRSIEIKPSHHAYEVLALINIRKQLLCIASNDKTVIRVRPNVFEDVLQYRLDID